MASHEGSLQILGLADVALDHVQVAGGLRPRQLGYAPQRLG